jgi:hypothetical protein
MDGPAVNAAPAATDSNPFDDIVRDVVAVWGGVGDTIAEQVKESLSVPCEVFHRIGPLKDRHHSRPGEHPKLEKGNLLNSIERTVSSNESTVTLSVDSDIFYAPDLELQMDRPIFRGVLEQYESRLVDAAADAIEGK